MNFNFNYVFDTDKNREYDELPIWKTLLTIGLIYSIFAFILGDWNIFNASVFARILYFIACVIAIAGQKE